VRLFRVGKATPLLLPKRRGWGVSLTRGSFPSAIQLPQGSSVYSHSGGSWWVWRTPGNCFRRKLRKAGILGRILPSPPLICGGALHSGALRLSRRPVKLQALSPALAWPDTALFKKGAGAVPLKGRLIGKGSPSGSTLNLFGGKDRFGEKSSVVQGQRNRA